MKQLRLPSSFSRTFSREALGSQFSLKQFIAAALALISRIDVLPANVSPLGSYGFFGNPVLYAVSILIFDLVIKGTYAGFLFTYLGFAMYPLLGYFTRMQPRMQLIALPTASFLFFLISNFGVWWHWYDRTWQDLMLCYGLALPFYTRTLASDLVFGYGVLALRHARSLREKMALAVVQ